MRIHVYSWKTKVQVERDYTCTTKASCLLCLQEPDSSYSRLKKENKHFHALYKILHFSSRTKKNMALGPHHWSQTTDHGIDVLNNIKRKETTRFIKQLLLSIIIWQLVQFRLSSWAEVHVHINLYSKHTCIK